MQHEAHEEHEVKPRAGLVRVGDRLERLASEVIAASIEVHKQPGPGYLESVYELALCAELQLRGVAFQRQATFEIEYKGSRVGEGRLDLLVESELIVEIKAVENVTDVHRSVVVSYLTRMKQPLALILNFNVKLMKHRIHRVIKT